MVTLSVISSVNNNTPAVKRGGFILSSFFFYLMSIGRNLNEMPVVGIEIVNIIAFACKTARA